MERNNYQHKEHQQSGDETEGTQHQTDTAAQQKASGGEWNEMRDRPSYKKEDEGGDTNDNPGGAGSTGSAATNS